MSAYSNVPLRLLLKQANEFIPALKDTLHNYGQMARGAGNYLSGVAGQAGNLAAGVGATWANGGGHIPKRGGPEAPGAKYLRAMDGNAMQMNEGKAQVSSALDALGTARRAQEPMGPFPGMKR
jgi:hypothetical protein